MEDFFRIYRGLELDDVSQFLTGAANPGASADTDAAPRGSFYTNTLDGSFWVKVSSGSGAQRWSQLATQSYVQNVSSTGISWREPADVADTVATTTAAIITDLNNDDTIQGVAVTAGMRVLAANVTGNKNVFVVGGAAGAWTLTEDVNSESSGDTVYVTSGTEAGKTYQYNGTNWVWVNSADSDEQAFIRTFIGKSGVGAEAPAYSSLNIVTNGGSLESAIGELDAEVGYANAFTGKLAGNVLPAYATNNIVANGDTLQAAIGKIDTKVGVNVVNGTAILAANTVNANITALDTEMGSIESFLGKIVGVGTPTYTSQTFITNGDSLQTAVGKIDAGLTEVGKKVVASGITTVTTVDSIAGAKLAEWDVRLEDANDALNVYAVKIFAVSNGADTDYSKFSVLKLGSGIPGVQVSADFSGGAIRLRVASSTSVNVVSKRITSFI